MLSFTQQPNGILFSGNKQIFGLSSTYSWQSTVNCTLKFYADSSKSTLLYSTTDTKSPTAGIVSFDIHAYLDAYLNAQDSTFDFAVLSVSHVQKTSNYVFCSVEFSQFDYENQQQGTTLSASFRVIKASTEPNTEYFIDFVNNYNAFLTFSPTPIRFSQKSGVFFSYFNSALRTLKLNCKFYYADNSTKLVVIHTASFTEGIFNFFYSYSELLIVSGSNFEKIEFWFQNSINIPVSNLLKFEFDAEKKLYERILVVENSVGGIDFLRIIGKISNESKYTRIQMLSNDQIRNVYSERIEQISANTGFFTSLHADFIAFKNWVVSEVISSNYAYLITDERVTEVRISSDSATSYEDGAIITSEVIKLENIRILKQFTLPIIDLPTQNIENEENYFVNGYINKGYYGVQ